MSTLNGYSIVSSMIAKNQKTKYFNPKSGIFLIEDDCLKFMDELIERFPDGMFDMIF